MARIALIHALAESVAPIVAELERQWSAAQRVNLLDDSLSADLARTGALDASMVRRFEQLADYAFDAAGCDAILYTCSAFGPCIDAVKRRHAHRPVLGPTQAMIEEAVAANVPIGLVASFAPTLASMPEEFPAGTRVRTALAEGALQALQSGDLERHDDQVAEAGVRLAQQGCGVIALAQFSLARAAARVAQRTGLPVFTTPAAAVRALRAKLPT